MNDLTQEDLERLLWAIDHFGWVSVAPNAGGLVLAALHELRQRKVEDRMLDEMSK